MNTCVVDDCQKPVRSGRAKWCAMHYHRWYRHGDVGKSARSAQSAGITVSNGRRYRLVHRPGHPVAGKRGLAYVHRVALYDTIGGGVHACHWCQSEVEWLPRGDPRSLHVDHLNNLGDDNRPENLVPSCLRCNGARGAQRRHDALVAAGWWSKHDTIEVLGSRMARVEAATV